MKVEVKKISTIKRELKFEVPKDRVSAAMDEVYKEFGKVAKIKGFRPGKVPRHVLEQHHGRQAHEETIRKLIPEIYQEGIEKESLHPIDMPEIHDVNLKDGKLTFTAKLELKPEVKIKDYKGLKVQRKDAKITDEDLTKTLDMIKQSQGKDKDFQIDDAFAKGLGFPNLEEFKQSLKRQMEMDKDRHNKTDVENQIIEALLKKTKVEAPPSLVKRQLERRLAENREHWKSHGMSEEDIAKKEEENKKGLQEAVEKDIQVYLILDKIAQEEGMDIQEGENLPAKVIEFLLKEASWG